MNCKKCIHDDVCIYQNKNDKYESCPGFKDSDEYIHLPCKIGDSVYLIPTYQGKPYCGIVEDKVQMIGVTSRGIHIKARNHHDHNKMYMLGKGAFLSRDEAAIALERSKSDA